MGVINVTPDSFSDGGQFAAPEQAVERARVLLADGADVLDFGAESTRPGAAEIEPNAEWARLRPVFELLARKVPAAFTQAVVSVDTRHASVMLKAVDAGARMVNDVGGGSDEKTLRSLARVQGMRYVAMHMHAPPATMQANPLRGEQAVQAVAAFFEDAASRLSSAGFDAQQIWLDPGFGFGKNDLGNYLILSEIPRWARRWNIAIGVSRKSFIGRTLGIEKAADRDPVSKGLELGLALAGARMIRTHDVAGLTKLLRPLKNDEGLG